MTFKRVLITLSFFSRAAFSTESTLSADKSFWSLAFARTQHVSRKAKTLPFNKELNQGTLSPKIFNRYLEQDGYYLDIYGSIVKRLSNKLPIKQREKFLIGQSISKEIKKNVNRNMLLTHANVHYTQFLLDVENSKPPAVMLAAIAPCQRLYGEVYLLSNEHNPFHYWLSVYQTKNYQLVTQQLGELLNEVYAQASKNTQEEMLSVYQQSMEYEVLFWLDAYDNRLSANVTYGNRAEPGSTGVVGGYK